MKYLNNKASYEAFKAECANDIKLNRMRSTVVFVCFLLLFSLFVLDTCWEIKSVSCIPTLLLVWLLKVKIKKRQRGLKEKYLDL